MTGTFTALIIRGWVSDRRGDLIAAEAEVGSAIEAIEQTGMGMVIASAAFSVQNTILERSSLDGLAALIEATQLDPAFLSAWGGTLLLAVRGRLRLARGDRKGAVEDLRHVAATARRLRFGPTMFAWRTELALALGASAGREARELACEEVEIARATGLARPYGAALRVAGALDPGENGITILTEAVSVLERTDAQLEYARSLVDLGAALRRRNRRAEARERLRVGMELAHRCGAHRLVSHAREELHAAGARPRRISRTGIDALTPSEVRVARLAAAGATNPEIAQDLFVTIKTVGAHLSNAYGKLGLSGQGARARLHAVLNGDPPTEGPPYSAG
jgi:DNA-binding CsgD family transcriptional regulator